MGFYRSYDSNVRIRRGIGITLETDDIVDFSSFEKGKEILEKYKISF